MAAGLEFFTSEVRPVDLDPLAYANRRNENAYRLNVITDPALRVIGFAVVAIGVWLHNATLLPAGTAPPIAPFVFLCVAYPLVSWATLALFYRSWKHLPFVLLFCDIGVLLAAVYFSGGERSYLFFLPLFRVVDQTHTSFRRAMLFGHVVVGGYALLMAWLMWSERHAVALGGEGAKLFALYASVLYTAFRARAQPNRAAGGWSPRRG